MIDKKVKPKRFGRGLDAIFKMEDISIENNEPILKTNEWEVEISKIEPNPNQPRMSFDDEELQELANSIKTLGIIQPITLKKDGRTFTIISGERRFRAAKLVGLTTIPAYIRTVSDANTLLEMALVENIQRSDLNALEISLSLQRLIEECKITQEQLAERVGKNRSTVANYIRLLKLPVEIQGALREDMISMGHARAILGIDSKLKQCSLLRRIIKHSLSVRQTEEIVKELLVKSKEPKGLVKDDYELPENYTRLVEQLEKYFTQDISIKKSKKGDGKIIINFKNDDDIMNILKRFEQL